MRTGAYPKTTYKYHLWPGFDVKSRNPIIILLPSNAMRSIILTMFVALAACQSQPPETKDAEPPAPQETPKRSLDPVVLHNLLDQAEEAIAQDHLTYPADNSAYAIYMRILDMQPGQEDALRGLEHIVEQYIALAMRALERHRYASARSMPCG